MAGEWERDGMTVGSLYEVGSLSHFETEASSGLQEQQ